MKTLLELNREQVRRVFPDAVLKTNGYMYWVESAVSDGEMISERVSNSERAWRSAFSFAMAR